MTLNPMTGIALAAAALSVMLAAATPASAQGGVHRLGELAPRVTVVPVEDIYPYNDLRWRRRLYGIPYPYPYFYQHVCGWERMPYGVGKKLRWRTVWRCH